MDQTQDPNATDPNTTIPAPGATSTPATGMPMEPVEEKAEMPGAMPNPDMPAGAPITSPEPPVAPAPEGVEPTPVSDIPGEMPGTTSATSEEPEKEEDPTGASTV